MGGIVFRAGDGLFYLPASAALKVLPALDLARVPGAPESLVGLALVDGEVVPVVSVGAPRSPMMLCVHLGERVAVVGIEVLACGFFEPSPDGRGVLHGGEAARPFDLGGLVSRMRTARWAV